MKKVILSIVLLMTCLQAQQEINFGVFAYMGYEKTKAKYEPLVNYLNENLDTPVKLHILKHAQMVQKVSKNELDIVTTNATNFLLFRKKYHLSGALATLLVNFKDKPVSQLSGVIVTKADSAINSLTDLKGKSIITPAKTRMGGFRTQAYELYKSGIDITKSAKRIIETHSSHQSVVTKMLENSSIDAAFIRSGTLEDMFAAKIILPEDIKVIHPIKHKDYPFISSTDLYPEWPVFAMPHLEESVIKEFIAALYMIKNDTNFSKESGIYGYTIPADYLKSEELARSLGLPPFEDTGKISIEDIIKEYGIYLFLFLTMIFLVIVLYIRSIRNSMKFKSLIENIGDGVYGVDKNGYCTWINPKALSLIGFTKDEVIGKHQHNLFHHTKPDGSLYLEKDCPISKTVADKKIRNGEENFITKKGEFFPVSYTCAPTKHGAIVVFRDITKAKTMEFELQTTISKLTESEQLLSGFVQNTSALIGIKDLEGRYLFANDAWQKATRYSQEEIIGKTDYDLFEQDVARNFRANDKKAIAKDCVVESEEFFDDGERRRYFIATKFPYNDFNAKIQGVCVVVTEITRIKESQSKVKINEQRYSSLLDSMQELIFIKDSKLRYLVTNKALEDFFQAKKEDIYFKTDLELMGEEQGKVCYLSDKDVLHKGSLVISEEEVNGRIYETHKFPVDLGSKEMGIGCFITDITEQKAAQKQIEALNNKLEQKVQDQTQKLQQQFDEIRQKDKVLQEQSKLAAMGEMINAIAHQWRQPLNALSINIQNLDDDFDEGLISKDFISEFIEKQSETIRFMSKTIDDFRHFFKTDKQKREFSIKTILENVYKIVYAQLKNHNVEFEVSGDDFDSYGYPSEMQQVFLNIINNAKDAIVANKHSGKISIVLDKESKKISFFDTGGGIEEKILDKIYEPYFTTKDPDKGTGLGLYLSRIIIVSHMKGEINAYNTDSGLCVEIDL